MLLEAARRHGIDLAASWMVGDSESDVEAGHRAGCRAVRVNSGAEPSTADLRVASLAELEERIGEILR
jgi:phosphoglycolate phosphatase-like HAD superfamily hydrolase